MLEETQLSYQLIDVSLDPEELSSPDYVSLNPNAKIPTLVDGDFVLFEAIAINQYLAQNYQSPMQTSNPQDHAHANQWGIWALSELETLLTQLFYHRRLLTKIARDPSRGDAAEVLLQKPLNVLNKTLEGKDYLLGSDFSVADINVAGMMNWAKLSELDFSPYPRVDEWLESCISRPAYQRVRDMIQY
jgi:glutathione S-transferase